MKVKAGEMKKDGHGNLHIRFDNGRYVKLMVNGKDMRLIIEEKNSDATISNVCPDLLVENLAFIAAMPPIK